MILDALLKFSDAQAVTAAAGSTNTIDFGVAGGRDIGTGESLYVVMVCDVAMTDSGSDSALTVSLEGDSTDSFTPDATDVLFTFPAVSAAGTVKIARLDPGMASLQYRYNRLAFAPTNGSLTTGSFSAYLTHNIQKFTAYADNSTIS